MSQRNGGVNGGLSRGEECTNLGARAPLGGSGVLPSSGNINYCLVLMSSLVDHSIWFHLQTANNFTLAWLYFRDTAVRQKKTYQKGLVYRHIIIRKSVCQSFYESLFLLDNLFVLNDYTLVHFISLYFNPD